MPPRQRTREDEDMLIKVAAGQSVPIKSFIARTFSSCAEQLPANAQEWDVSGLLNDSQPFSREAVHCWVECAYCASYVASELGTEAIQQLSTAKGLQQVLAFAQAVGSAAGLLAAACSQLESLKIVVPLPEQTLELEVKPQIYRFIEMEFQLVCNLLQRVYEVGQPLVSSDQVYHVQQQVAAQVGALLHLAHVLRLPPLLDLLHKFVFWNVVEGFTGLLYGVLNKVFTDQVFEAALGSGTVSRETYMASVLNQSCNLITNNGSAGALLQLDGEVRTSQHDAATLEFSGKLLQDFAGSRAGENVAGELSVMQPNGSAMLTLEGRFGSMTFGGMDLPVRLVMGPNLDDPREVDMLCNTSRIPGF